MRIVTGKQRTEITQFFGQMRDTARLHFERDAFCEPVALFLQDQAVSVLPLREFINDKDAASAILNKAIEAVQPLAFVLITEAWMAKADEQPADAGGKPVDLREKYQGHLTETTPGGDATPKQGVKEVVMLQCSSVAGDNFMLTADIVRAEGAAPALMPWVQTENVRAEGRFIFDVTPLVERQ
ncbi:MAG: hypothetical protein ACLQVA_12960 [Candidatus Brocadiia bacterium]